MQNLIQSNTIQQNLDFQQDWEMLESQTLPVVRITEYINTKNLACPMPLLKLKMALKNMAIGDTMYMTATDPNSTHDIGAFCQHLGYSLWTIQSDSDSATIFHLLITKNS